MVSNFDLRHPKPGSLDRQLLALERPLLALVRQLLVHGRELPALVLHTQKGMCGI
jgi:hypothetical protein